MPCSMQMAADKAEEEEDQAMAQWLSDLDESIDGEDWTETEDNWAGNEPVEAER